MKLRLYGPNLLGNPGGERGDVSGWGLFYNTASYGQASLNVATTAVYSGSYSFFVNVVSAGAGLGDIQMYQQNVRLPAGVPVALQYAGKADVARLIRVSYILGMTPYSTYFSQTNSLNTSWELFENTFTLTQDVNSGSIRFYAGSGAVIDFHLDETSVRNYLELPVTYGYERAEMLTRQDVRGAAGALQSYIEPNPYRRFTLPLVHVGSAARSLINSWWVTGSELRLVEDATYPFNFHAVRIVGGEEPLTKFMRPYNNEYEGELVLETV